MPRRLLLFFVVVVAVASQAAGASAAIPAWTTYRHDAARSGIDPDSTNPVTPTQAWQTPALDGEVYGQPLVYGAYVYVTTENDTVYKLDAASGAVVWSNHLATPEPSSAAPCGDITPSIGITGTPVIDPATNRIYAVGAVSSSGTIHHQLFALDLGSGQLASGYPITVDPPFPSGGTPVNQLQRPGLALDGNRVLIGYGGNDGDCATYWGWLVSVAVDGSGTQNAFQVDAGHTEGAIWGSGNAPPIDSAGNVFVATGNGNGNSSSDPEYGDTVVKLNSAASPLDFWAPPNWQNLDNTDADLGSSLPTLLPGGYVFQSGKDGNGYLVNGAALGHVSAPARQVSVCSGGSFGGSVFDPSNSTLYVTCSGGLKALTIGSGSPPTISAKPGFAAPPAATGPPMIAGGLVWSANRSSGTLYGLDPSTGATRSHLSIPELGSNVNHFATPSAAGGRLFMGSGNQVTAFTIAQTPGPTPTSTTLASSPNPATGSATVTLTATVTPAPDAGTVAFTDGGAGIPGCSAVAATAGRAICHTKFTHAGTHKLAGAYSGDAFYAPSSSATLSESVANPPSISRVTLGPRRFKARHATTLRLTLDEAATVTFAVTKLRPGHMVNGRCRVNAHRGKKCSTSVTLAKRHLKSPAGRHKFKLAFHRLAPGRYTALVYATDRAGLRSRTVRITFTILRPGRR
jgi:outer membrane protein assembly factor BamB